MAGARRRRCFPKACDACKENSLYIHQILQVWRFRKEQCSGKKGKQLTQILLSAAQKFADPQSVHSTPVFRKYLSAAAADS